jgi:hypothetical protein
MLSSITPLGERSRAQRYGITAVFLLIGAAGSSAAVGAILGGIGSLLPLSPTQRLLTLAAAGCVGTAAELVLRRGVPTHLRQVDELWLRRYRGWVYGLGFGAQFGTGIATVVTSSAVYLVLIGAFLAQSATAGMLIGLCFGAARGCSVFLSCRIDSPARLSAFHRRFSRLEPAAARAGVALQAIVLAVALSVAA